MKVREATGADRERWNAFVDVEGGGLFHYYDWKPVHEAGGCQFIPLLVEGCAGEVAGILPMVRHKHLLYSNLDSARMAGVEGLLLKRDLSDGERLEATCALIEHVDRHWSRGCAVLNLVETLAPGDNQSEQPTAVLLEHGFRFRYEARTRLPCSFVLQIQPPFEQNVWRRWSRMIRQGVQQAEARGTVVAQDPEMRHAGLFMDMLRATYARHRTKAPSREEVRARLEVFRDRSKMFVALSGGQPVAILLCHYTRQTCYLSKIGSYEKDTDDANKLCWKAAIEDACAGGYAFVDFGATTTAGLAFFKERFRGTRVPVRLYEKRYSIPGTVMHKAPLLLRNAWHDRGYLWRNRRLIWDRVVRI